MNPTPALSGVAAATDRLSKVYGVGDAAVRALDEVTIDIARGEFTAIMGASGSGKSTLMHCLAGLDTATSGRVWLAGVELTGLRDADLTRNRREHVGFVFQEFNLLPQLTAEQNIVLPLELAGRRPDRARLDHLVGVLGLASRLRHTPSQLSGGQQQRVALARALVTDPAVIFADEPTGNLDSRSGAEVLALLRRSVREFGQTVVMVTHDPIAACYADRVLLLEDGRLAGGLSDPTPDRVLDVLRRLGSAA
jgi:putative ABC transport system ATP-binding protein